MLISPLIGLGQISKKYKYVQGVGANFNIPIVQSNSSDLTTYGGVGLDFNQMLVPANNKLILSSKIGYNLSTYNSVFYNYKFRANNAQAGIGLKKHFAKMDSLGISFHVLPNYTFLTASDEAQKAGSVGSSSKFPFNDTLNKRFNVGLNLGIELLSQNNSSFEIGYVGQLRTENRGAFIDAQPHRLYLRINFNFGESVAPVITPYQKEIASDLEKFSEGTDTLYILNRSCKEQLTDNALDSLFTKYYRFSQFRLIQTGEIESIRTNGNTKFFALVGSHYARLDDPESVGIFLLDKNMKLVEFPYPVLTMYSAFGDKCLNDLDIVSESIQWFNRRLNNRAKYETN